MAHTLAKLEYDYSALEPHIDAQTMEIHHSKHHQGYVNKLNTALEKHPELMEKSLEDLLKDLNSIPEDIRTAVRNTGGGTYNHNFFWTIMGPEKGSEPSGELAEAISSKFGSFEEFKKEFSAAAATVFGSGWAWLSVDSNGELVLSKSSNQDCPLSEGNRPILNLDVWEHSYYLKYQNLRPDYISAWWNVVNWDKVAEYFKG